MRRYALTLLALFFLVGPAVAQPYTVTTPGLVSGECVQATGLSTVADAPCSGRTQVITVSGTSRTLTVDECGAYIVNPSISANSTITLPSSPPSNCMFTFEPGLHGFYVNTSDKVAKLPAYSDVDLTQFTILSSDLSP